MLEITAKIAGRGCFCQSVARLVAVAFLATLALAPFSVVAQSDDLATVLSKQQNVSNYLSLLSKYPDVFSKLPSSGATILVPTDAAFVRFQEWDRRDPAYAASLLQYHILQGKVSISNLALGASIFAPTILTDTKYTNVTGGAVLMVSKQPGQPGKGDVVVFTSGMATRATLVGSPDIPFKGGSVQLIDSILTQPARLELTAREAYQDLSSFLGATYAADVATAFSDTANITIFAPRNLAMQLVSGALQSMSKEQLGRVLRYHMVPERVIHSAELRNDSDFVTAVQGAPSLSVTRFNNEIFVGSGRVIQTDILIANGVVHMLEDVLNPDAGRLRPDVTAETQRPVFNLTAGPASTGTAAPIPFTSALPCTINCPVTNSPSGTGSGAGSAATGTSVKTSSSSGFAARAFVAKPSSVPGMIRISAGMGVAIVGLGGVEAIARIV